MDDYSLHRTGSFYWSVLMDLVLAVEEDAMSLTPCVQYSVELYLVQKYS